MWQPETVFLVDFQGKEEVWTLGSGFELKEIGKTFGPDSIVGQLLEYSSEGQKLEWEGPGGKKFFAVVKSIVGEEYQKTTAEIEGDYPFGPLGNYSNYGATKAEGRSRDLIIKQAEDFEENYRRFGDPFTCLESVKKFRIANMLFKAHSLVDEISGEGRVSKYAKALKAALLLDENKKEEASILLGVLPEEPVVLRIKARHASMTGNFIAAQEYWRRAESMGSINRK
ncbi:hypothetical protein [Deinococcus planocerae]|uniref:hypothetical protein n=1 Tax=Deinococcus planocerae TaxID=1737569 RepID=UPI0011AFB8F8|nr:hypothetical protein [Deinococcus planocerae]